MSVTVQQGYARCVNTGCESFDQDRQIDIERSTVQIRGEKPLQNLVISETEYFHPVNDGDIACPDCGQPCALLPEKRRVVPVGRLMV